LIGFPEYVRKCSHYPKKDAKSPNIRPITISSGSFELSSQWRGKIASVKKSTTEGVQSPVRHAGQRPFSDPDYLSSVIPKVRPRNKPQLNHNKRSDEKETANRTWGPVAGSIFSRKDAPAGRVGTSFRSQALIKQRSETDRQKPLERASVLAAEELSQPVAPFAWLQPGCPTRRDARLKSIRTRWGAQCANGRPVSFFLGSF